MTTDYVINEIITETDNDEIKIKEFLKKVDSRYYHWKIKNRMEEMRKFPLLGEDGSLFINTYQYVNLVPKLKKNK